MRRVWEPRTRLQYSRSSCPDFLKTFLTTDPDYLIREAQDHELGTLAADGNDRRADPIVLNVVSEPIETMLAGSTLHRSFYFIHNLFHNHAGCWGGPGGGHPAPRRGPTPPAP
jgi:hypothetical protein